MASLASLLQPLRSGAAGPAVGVAGESVVALAGAWPAWRVVEAPADAARVVGLAPGQVRVSRVTLPPSDAAVAARVAGVRAEGLLPEGVAGETAAGVADGGHRVWIAGVSAAARGHAAGPVADAATGLGAVLASSLGLAGEPARLSSGVLLVAAARGRVALVRVDADGPAEAVVVDDEAGPAAAVAEGTQRLDGTFTACVGVGDAAEDFRGGGPPLGAWIPGEQAFAGLVAAGHELAGDGWLAAGAAGAAAAPGLPVPGVVTADGGAGRGAPSAKRWGVAAAAVLAGAAALAWADLSAAARLDAALADRPGLAAAEAQLASDTARYRWLEEGGPTPLAIVDELTSLFGGVVPRSIRVSADGIELEGTAGDASQIDGLVERLTGARTFTSVKLQRTQAVGDREVSYAIDAEPVERFYDAFVAAPVEEDAEAEAEADAEADTDADAEPPAEDAP